MHFYTIFILENISLFYPLEWDYSSHSWNWHWEIQNTIRHNWSAKGAFLNHLLFKYFLHKNVQSVTLRIVPSLRMGENICKWINGQRINLQNINSSFSSILKKQTTQSKNGQKIWIDISPKKIYRWPTDTWKNAQHH